MWPPRTRARPPAPLMLLLSRCLPPSGLQQPPQHAIASPRGRSSERVTSERSRHASPSFQDRLRLHIDDVRRQLSNTMEIDDLYRRKAAFLQTKSVMILAIFKIASPTFSLRLQTRWHRPLVLVHQPLLTLSPLQLPPLSPSGSSTSRFSSRHDRRYDQRVASSDIRALSGGPCSRESTQTSPRHPSSQRFSSSRRSMSPRRTPSPTRRRDTSRRTPSPARRSSSRRTPSPQRRAASKGSSRSKKRSPRDSLSPRRGSPPPKRQRRQERDSVSPSVQRSSRASSREPSQERPGSRSPHGQASPSREEKEAEDAPIPATVKAMVDFIKSNFPDAIASQSSEVLQVF